MMLDLIPIHCHNPAFVNYGFKGYDKMFKIKNRQDKKEKPKNKHTEIFYYFMKNQ